MYLLTAAIKNNKKTTAKGRNGQKKTDSLHQPNPAHQVTHKNLLKSKQFSLAIKEYNDGAVTMWLSKLFRHQHKLHND